MLPRAKRSKRTSLLAAPIVVTAMFAPACESRIYRNPGPPKEPQTPATASAGSTDGDAVPTSGPITTAVPPASASPEPEPEELKPIPENGGGRVEFLKDGTCLYVYPPPQMSCPPTATCNPGPPRQPLKVKCPKPVGNGP